MIEMIMIFALGFLTAGLVALMIVPAVNRRAERLAKRRLETLFPLSASELTAERDHIRAEFALKSRRFEQRIDALAGDRAAAMKEAGQRAFLVKTLEAEIAAAKAAVEGLDTETDVLRKNLSETRETLAMTDTRLRETSDTLAARETTLQSLGKDYRGALDDLDARRIQIADLETRSASFEARLADTQRTFATRTVELDDTRKNLAQRDRTISDERAESATLRDRLTLLEAIRGDQARRIETLQASESELAKKLTEATLAATRRDNLIADQDTRLIGLGRRVAELEARLRVENEASKGEVRAMAEALEITRAERITLEGVLEQARADRMKLQRELTTLKRETERMSETARAEDAALRARIEDVAADIVRLAGERESPPARAKTSA